MRSRVTQAEILEAIVNEALRTPDCPIEQAVLGDRLFVLEGRRVGLASLIAESVPQSPGRRPAASTLLPEPGASAHRLAQGLLAPDGQGTNAASLAMAAVNALLSPPLERPATWGQDALLERGKGKAVAVVGHFPFVDDMRLSFSDFWVLEKNPHPGDLDASMAAEVLPRADVVAITGTTLLNGTLAELLNLCRNDALVILLGPSTPFASCLFDLGVGILAGCEVNDPDAVISGVKEGRCFRHLTGVQPRAWEKPKTP